MEDELFNALVQSVKEMNAIERELIDSVKEMVAVHKGELEPARVTVLETPNVAEVRRTLGLSQAEFSALL